jgi:hypothetical protein
MLTSKAPAGAPQFSSARGGCWSGAGISWREAECLGDLDPDLLLWQAVAPTIGNAPRRVTSVPDGSQRIGHEGDAPQRTETQHNLRQLAKAIMTERHQRGSDHEH